MKKIYEKPGFCVESFQIAQSIAADCVHSPSFGGAATCAFTPPDLPGRTIFTDENTKCKYTPFGSYDGLCYHTPTAGQNIFGS